MNRKGQIATTLLVIAALILSGMALYTMISFNDDIRLQSAVLNRLTNDAVLLEEYVLEQAKVFGKDLVLTCPSCSREELKVKGQEFDVRRKTRPDGIGNFYGKLRNGEFTFKEQEGNFTLEIPNLLVQPEYKSNKIRRNFDLCLEFNQTGDYNKSC
ncbi:MAG: hypothetical protein ABIH92_03845 [Nanoarchaeota archaeon]